MSASDRRARDASAEERRFVQDAMNGLQKWLSTPDGRASCWFVYDRMMRLEHAGDVDPRRLAEEFARACKMANWNGWQQMREEYERPAVSVADEEEE